MATQVDGVCDSPDTSNKENEDSTGLSKQENAVEVGLMKGEDETELNMMGFGVEQHDGVSRVSSPRRVRDIHLDGTTDNMPDVDPYMLDERDLDIQSDAGGQAGSVSDMSERSWKSLRTPQTLKTRSAGSSVPRSSIASRARQIKDHEADAFLSIDLLPDAAVKPGFSSSRGHAKTSVRDSQHSLLSVSSSGLISQRSKSVASGTGGQASNRVTGRRLLSASSFTSPVKPTPSPNPNVKMPFKHTVNKPAMKTPAVSPGQAMTERTAFATHMVNKVLRDQRPSRTTYIQGRLLKARLKPMEPVDLTGPTIHQCRGIVAETRSYSPCNSRTFQRWKAIMSGAQVAGDMNMNQDIKDRASICESVHRTSEASSPEATMDLLNDLDGDLEDDELLDDLEDARFMNGDGMTQEDERVLMSASLPNSRAGPAHCDTALADLTGPDFQIAKQDSEETAVPSEEVETTTTAEVNQVDNDVVKEEVKVGDNDICSSESAISSSTLFRQSDKEEIAEEKGHVEPVSSHFGSKRPHSATYPQESQWSRPSSQRPKTAVDASSRKAVRFADEPKLAPQETVEGNTENKGSVKGNGSKGKASCRPHSLDSGYHDRDDSENGGQGGGRDLKGNIFLTQESVQAPKGNSKGQSSSSQQNRSGSSGGKKKSHKTKTTINFRYSNLVTEPAEVSSKQSHLSVHSGRNEIDVLHHMQENSRNLARPLSASVMYVDSQQKVSEAQNQPKIVDSEKIKRRLDARFAAYKNKKKDSKIIKHAVEEAIVKSNTSCKTENENILETKSVNCGHEEMSERVTDVLKMEKDDQKDLKSTVGKFFEATDYSKYSRVAGRPPSASSRKAKAYKILKSKARAGNGRPFSASTYSDREVSDRKSRISSARKDLRPNSAQIFTEKTDILSKHGLISNYVTKNRPDSAKKRPDSSSSLRQTNSKKSGKSDKSANENMHTEEDDGHDGVQKPRIKSANRVTFADENEYAGDGKPRTRGPSARKAPSGHSNSCHGSTTSLDSHRLLSTSGSGDDGFDADLMWEELPSDHSDDEFDEGVHHLNEEDPFMTKFDLLESQFEVAKAELQGERMKSIMDFYTIRDNLYQEPDNNKTKDEKYHTTQPESLFLTTGNEDREYEKTETNSEALQNVKVSDQEKEETEKVMNSETSPFFTMAKYQRREFLQEAVISSCLYKKTNLYVEVVTKDQHHKHTCSAWVKKSGTERGEKKRRSSHSEQNANGNTQHKEGKTEISDKDKINNTDTNKEAPIVIPTSAGGILSSGNSNTRTTEEMASEKANVEGVAEVQKNSLSQSENVDESQRMNERKLETRKQLEKDYPHLTSMQRRRGSKTETVDSKKDMEVPLSARSENEENLQQSEGYEELLQAYRQHCMRSSDDDDEDDEDGDGAKRKKSFTKRLSMSKARPGTVCERCAKHNLRHGMGKGHERGKAQPGSIDEGCGKSEVAKQRPWSATTTDSGLESDCQSNVAEESFTSNINHSDTGSLHVEARAIALNAVSGDQSQKAKNQRDQSSTSSDSEPLRAAGDDADRKQGRTNHDKSHLTGNSAARVSSTSKKTETEEKSSSLEIVAHAKTMSRPRRPPKDKEDMATLCKVPPLCFRLNARPPRGYLYYFAYGPTMNPDRLATYLGCEKAPPRFWALLYGFDLVFNMKGSKEREIGGFPNLEYNPSSSVEGCIFQLTPGQLDCLDKFMGYPQVYEHVVLPTWMSNTPSPDDLGVAQYCVPAVTYIAQDDSTWQDPVRPNEFSLSQCIKAADLLTPSYRSHLSAFSSSGQELPLAITAA